MIITDWELVAQQGYFDEGRSILIFIERTYLFIIEFNTKSLILTFNLSVFLNTAHLIHIAVPSFNLALYKGRDSTVALLI